MTSHDNAFFEEYKCLEKICSDMYSCRNGVSEYIGRMEQKAAQGRRRVSSWDEDYKMLKHVRWVRNRIAHDEAAGRVSEAADLAFVKDFHKRLLSGRDPLTLLRKVSGNKSGKGKARKAAGKKPRSRRWLLIATAAAAIVLLALSFYFMR